MDFDYVVIAIEEERTALEIMASMKALPAQPVRETVALSKASRFPHMRLPPTAIARYDWLCPIKIGSGRILCCSGGVVLFPCGTSGLCV